MCAIREFSEETRIPVTDIKVVQKPPFIENFRGSNGKTYSTHYYLAEIPTVIYPEIYDTPQCIRKSTVSEEASQVRWIDLDQASKLLNPRRYAILQSAVEQISGL
jgi:8-oxo-dGTP pyrophosphatase MutT (NUDIX family)